MLELRQSGSVSWEGPTRHAFLFDELGLTLQQWMERAADGDEIGVRAELHHFAADKPAEDASEFAAKVMTLSRPIWRADIFTLTTGEPGNFARAHFHPRFDGTEPCERDWDPNLSADPFAWLAQQLTDLPRVLARAGAGELAGSPDCARAAALAGEIAQVARACMIQVLEAGPDVVPR
jgi:hypothetical protein